MQKTPLLIFLNQPYVFRGKNSPILGITSDCIYSFLYNAPTLLPTGDTVEMELFLNQPYMFQATNSPILRKASECIYSFLYNAPTLLPTGDTFEMEIWLVACLVVLVMHAHTDIYFARISQEIWREGVGVGWKKFRHASKANE
jgi:hypothetical protein